MQRVSAAIFGLGLVVAGLVACSQGTAELRNAPPIASPLASPALGPQPTRPPAPAPHSDAGTLDGILERWAYAAAGIRTLRGQETYHVLREDANGQPISDMAAAGAFSRLPQAVGEAYELPGEAGRYRYAAHFPAGDETTLWDGANAYRYWSWLGEVYRPLPESFAASAYWTDEVSDASLARLLYLGRNPSGDFEAAFDLVGPRDLDRHKAIELTVGGPPLVSTPWGPAGSQVYLDAVSYLPWRVRSLVNTPDTDGRRLVIERTVVSLEINPALTAGDFALPLPGDTVTVYEQAHWAPPIQVYASATEAAQQAGFPLFLPRGSQPLSAAPAGGSSVPIYARYLVEQNGKRSPVIALQTSDGLSLLEGLYLPKASRPGGTQALPGDGETLDAGGQKAGFRQLGPLGSVLDLSKQGTQIEISGAFDRDRARRLITELEWVR